MYTKLLLLFVWFHVSGSALAGIYEKTEKREDKANDIFSHIFSFNVINNNCPYVDHEDDSRYYYKDKNKLIEAYHANNSIYVVGEKEVSCGNSKYLFFIISMKASYGIGLCEFNAWMYDKYNKRWNLFLVYSLMEGDRFSFDFDDENKIINIINHINTLKMKKDENIFSFKLKQDKTTKKSKELYDPIKIAATKWLLLENDLDTEYKTAIKSFPGKLGDYSFTKKSFLTKFHRYLFYMYPVVINGEKMLKLDCWSCWSGYYSKRMKNEAEYFYASSFYLPGYSDGILDFDDKSTAIRVKSKIESKTKMQETILMLKFTPPKNEINSEKKS